MPHSANPLVSMIRAVETNRLLDSIEHAAALADVPAKPTDRQLLLMCGLWGAADLIRDGEHPLVACLIKSGETC
jgi:hypothetical protein